MRHFLKLKSTDVFLISPRKRLLWYSMERLVKARGPVKLCIFLFYAKKNGRYACHLISICAIHAENFPFTQEVQYLPSIISHLRNKSNIYQVFSVYSAKDVDVAILFSLFS